MSSINDFPKLSQPYPETNPWYDLSSLITNGWENGSSAWTLKAQVIGNTVNIDLRTRFGTSHIIVNKLPDDILPATAPVFQVWTPLTDAGIGLRLPVTGSLSIFAPGRGLAGLTDGTLQDMTARGFYTRRAA